MKSKILFHYDNPPAHSAIIAAVKIHKLIRIASSSTLFVRLGNQRLCFVP